MVTEDYVSFETAKLLKEKGFDEYCGYYDRNGEYWDYRVYNHRGEDYISAPTLQMAMKWLREVQNLVVNPAGHYVNGKLQSWEVDIYFLDCGVDATINAMGHIYGKTYECACENGIKYCLENLVAKIRI